MDIDTNSDVARQIVERLLPPTGWRYGRTSKPRSHANYLVRGQLRTRKYAGLGPHSGIELRGLTKKNTYTLSVGPGSIWTSEDKTQREPIRFAEPRGDIGRVDNPDDLDRAVQEAAVGMAIGQVWPATNRHRLRLAFAKVLLEHGIAADRCRAVLEAVMAATGSDVGDVADVVRDTAVAIRTGHAAGASVVVEILGDNGRAILDVIARILRASVFDETAGILMQGGHLSAIVDRVETALLGRGIFQRGGLLTRAVTLDRAIGDPTTADVRREAGTTVLTAVREPWLTEQMGRAVPWFKAHTDGPPSPADPAPIYARTLLSRGEWRFPVLRGIVTAPTLARDGRIIETPGFDVASGLLVDIVVGSFPPVPSAPTRDEAQVALAQLAHPLRAFPFVDDAAKSVALSALLTALIRVSLRTSPLHGYDAPTAGTGKSLLAEMAGLLATGFRPPALSQGKSDEEDEKRLSTILFAGDPIIHIDNCERPIAGDFLCSMLTQEVVQARILGLSERRVLPATALVLASGNNLAFAGDTSRRSVVCRLDAEVERPDTRTFDFDCHADVLAARPELVVAALTILRAYHQAGRPTRVSPMGSFTDWEWVRGALVWLGCADPADTRVAILDNDPRKSDLLEVMDLWAQVIGTTEYVEVADIDRRAEAYAETLAAIQHRDGVKGLRNKLAEVACRGKWSGTSVGRWLNRHKDRVVGGRSFGSRPGGGRGVMAWKLTTRGTDGQTHLPGTT